MNAYTDGDIVTCDVCEFKEPPLFPPPDVTPGDPSKAIPRATRWTFDMAKIRMMINWSGLMILRVNFRA